MLSTGALHMKKTFILFFLVLSSQAFALDATKCTSEEFSTLGSAHELAKSYIEKAHEILEKDKSPLIALGFKKYFNVDYHSADHEKYVNKVKGMMFRLWDNVGRVRYKCASNSGLYCSPGILALVPPLSRIQVCPSYFSRNFEKQVGTLIHEWGHRWGFFRLKYIFEKYCDETVGADASVLTLQPDSYMLFTYYLATDGRGIACFKVEDRQ